MNVTVKDLAGAVKVLAGAAGLDRRITSPQLATPDLVARAFGKDAASGIMHIRPSQAAYLGSLDRDERLRLVRAVLKQKPAGILFTGGAVCGELLEKAESAKIPVLKSRNLQGLRRILTEKLQPSTSLHGVLVQIFGLGTLIVGESAIGKSEAALDLVLRGHKLAADDLVLVVKGEDGIIGRAADLGRELLQIRGLGIINIRAIFGPRAICRESKVDLVIWLKKWQKGDEYDRLGLEFPADFEILGVKIPQLIVPVAPGRTIALLIEVACKVHLLRKKGYHASHEIVKKLDRALS
jgi:HPr kinase/phosphorylase